MIVSPFAHPLYVMLKPAGARCNLACRYCYYLDKSKYYADSPVPSMADDLLEEFIRQYIAMQPQREVLFTWHGGETMLRPLSFYRHAVRLQRKHAHGHVVDNCIQTNGTLIDDEWCRFLRDEHWLVGLSVDGPQLMHDAYRKDRGGRGTFARVMRAVELLDRHGAEWNAMAVVNRLNAMQPLAFYRFFKSIGCRFLQFTPVVEPDQLKGVTDESVRPEQWGHFLCEVFDEWVCHDVGDMFVQLFDATLANWVGVEPGVCSMAAHCGHALVMEFNGDVYSCDHFVFPEYRLGNLRVSSLAEMAYGTDQQAFRMKKSHDLPAYCRACPYLFACHGECPKNRLLTTPDGEAGLNFLCRGYRSFFAHSAPYMEFMAAEWRSDGAPAAVIDAIADGRLPHPRSFPR